MKKTLLTLVMAATLSGPLLLSTNTPADAARCKYIAHNHRGTMVAWGRSRAPKLRTACQRAQRRCIRDLNRAIRQRRSGRGARCIRVPYG